MNTSTDDDGRHVIAGMAPVSGGGERLHWSVQPFWHDLRVRLHRDGISVAAAGPERTVVATVPAQSRPVDASNSQRTVAASGRGAS
jgi:hypothetical protein